MARSPATRSAGFACCSGSAGNERTSVGLVLAAKLAIKPSDLVVGGKQDRDLAAQLHGRLRLTEKAGERARGRNSVVPGMSRWVGTR